MRAGAPGPLPGPGVGRRAGAGAGLGAAFQVALCLSRHVEEALQPGRGSQLTRSGQVMGMLAFPMTRHTSPTRYGVPWAWAGLGLQSLPPDQGGPHTTQAFFSHLVPILLAKSLIRTSS